MPCVDMVATGKRIKAMRVAKGMTEKDVQEIFGFGSANTIYKWQNGESMPARNMSRSCITMRERYRLVLQLPFSDYCNS